MKIFIQLLGLGLLLFGQPQYLSAQTPNPDCQDIIRLKNGSTLRGQIQELKNEGQTLIFQSWNGVVFTLQQTEIRRITQSCKDDKTNRPGPKPYHFKEQGWYHHTRAGILAGQAYYGENRNGGLFQHSSGWKFNRHLGLGLGVGIAFFDSQGNDAVTYPVFAELQGYLLPKNITPFYSVGAGWAFTGRSSGERWNKIDQWKGGWMAQTAVGYRIGRYFTIQTGVQLQHKRRVWTSVWGGPESGSGEDRILHKRLIVAIGLTL